MPLPGVRFERERYWAAMPAGLPAAAPGEGTSAPVQRGEEREMEPEASPAERLEEWLRHMVALAVGRPAAACDPEANLHDLGVDSIAAIRRPFAS